MLNKIFIEQPSSEPKVKAYIPIYEPLEVVKCKKCEKIIADSEELMSFEKVIIMKKPLSRKEQRKCLYRKIEKPVAFNYPELRNKEMKFNLKTKKYVLEGELLKRYVLDVEDDIFRTYWFVFDLIKFKGEEENWIRLTYYRYLKGKIRWVYAGQTSLSAPYSVFLKFFVEAIKKEEWIASLFREVYNQCIKELNVEKL